MRTRMLSTVFVFLVAALSLQAGTITSVNPNSIAVDSGEWFTAINGTGLGDVVTFAGPAGTFNVPINATTRGGVIVWVPTEVVDRAGNYTVVVHGGSGDTAPAAFTVTGGRLLSLQLVMPEVLLQLARTREGSVVNFDVTAVGGDDPSPVVDCAPKSGANFRIGTTLVQCVASNRSGERVTGQFGVTVFDGLSPVVTVPKSFSVNADGPSGAIVKFDASATDDIDGAITPSCSPASGSRFPVGTTTVVCTATDSALNPGGEQFDVRVVFDRLVLNVPKLAIGEADDAKGGHVYFDVTAASPKDPSPTIKCDANSGDFFSLGSTTVSCEATDRSGDSATARFEVKVVDSVGPIIAGVLAKPSWILPNGTMNTVGVDVDAFDIVDPQPKCAITGVSGNEPVEGDYRVTGDLTVDLLGASKNGNRVYAISLVCKDVTGNFTEANVNVAVSEKEPPPPTLTISTTPAHRRP